MEQSFELIKPKANRTFTIVMFGIGLVLLCLNMYNIYETKKYFTLLLPIVFIIMYGADLLLQKKWASTKLLVNNSFMQWQVFNNKEVANKVVVWADIEWIKKESNEYTFYSASSFSTTLNFSIILPSEAEEAKKLIDKIIEHKQLTVK